jgi:REP element-mobilizing transposase RayT
MSYDPEIHHRRSIRLAGYDYAQPGAYFVTLCVQDRLCILGEIAEGEMHPNTAGLVIASWWEDIPRRFPGSELDRFVVMPNHLHGIVLINGVDESVVSTTPEGGHTGPPLQVSAHSSVGADRCVRPAAGTNATPVHEPHLARIVQWFKTMTTNDYILGVKTDGWPSFRKRFWQRDYYEHIVRNDAALDRIRAYIANNPATWTRDPENPDATPTPPPPPAHRAAGPCAGWRR